MGWQPLVLNLGIPEQLPFVNTCTQVLVDTATASSYRLLYLLSWHFEGSTRLDRVNGTLKCMNV